MDRLVYNMLTLCLEKYYCKTYLELRFLANDYEAMKRKIAVIVNITIALDAKENVFFSFLASLYKQ